MRGGARGPRARRTLCTLSVRPRAPTKQMGLFQQPAKRAQTMPSRLLGIVVKEFIHLKRDLLALTLALAVPVAMLFIFGWAINTDVKHIPTAVFEQSGSLEARLFLEAMENSQYFDVRRRVSSHKELTRLIDSGEAKVGVVIPRSEE